MFLNFFCHLHYTNLCLSSFHDTQLVCFFHLLLVLLLLILTLVGVSLPLILLSVILTLL